MNNMNISIVPYDRKDWIVKKDKFIRYKLFTYRKCDYSPD